MEHSNLILFLLLLHHMTGTDSDEAGRKRKSWKKKPVKKTAQKKVSVTKQGKPSKGTVHVYIMVLQLGKFLVLKNFRCSNT